MFKILLLIGDDSGPHFVASWICYFLHPDMREDDW